MVAHLGAGANSRAGVGSSNGGSSETKLGMGFCRQKPGYLRSTTFLKSKQDAHKSVNHLLLTAGTKAATCCAMHNTCCHMLCYAQHLLPHAVLCTTLAKIEIGITSLRLFLTTALRGTPT